MIMLQQLCCRRAAGSFGRGLGAPGSLALQPRPISRGATPSAAGGLPFMQGMLISEQQQHQQQQQQRRGMASSGIARRSLQAPGGSTGGHEDEDEDGDEDDDDEGWDAEPDQLKRQCQARLARFTQPRDPDNPLLHDLWEPWARGSRFVNQRFRIMRPDYTSQDYTHDIVGSMLRMGGIQRYAWAVPTAEALGLIAEVSGGRVVEVGAGSGYWAGLLARRGVDVVAVDTGEEDAERESAGGEAEAQEAEEGESQEQQQPAPAASKLHFPAMQKAEAAQFLAEHGGCPDRALLLCWARYEMGGPCLAAYRGDTVVAVGEVDDGATWWLDTEEHPEWRQLRRVPLPNWPGIHNDLRVYKRVVPVEAAKE
ncbi:hypothetical protein HYH02_001608 [Chlamydomonas schloesseri]|uniref:Uncharacterized protein n=1 Tax=Chlamydomonas schloesseri TaxID=2026947 RepID=A0A836BC20_9CHLO|nr:hypothetical protein HYH02_001608 [Chlamydomonas schloesseri]|eukprot:KAG2453384.1 hypothetical protein HYH02_001608 [Chlamydomonas schloesseri]